MQDANKILEKFLVQRWSLVQDTTPQGAKKLYSLDSRLRKKFERAVAPFVLDMAGFTRITIQRGILHYLTMIQRMVALCEPIVRKSGGRLIKHEADNLFACFPKVADAIDSAARVQETLYGNNLLTEEQFDIHTSIGIGFGPTFLVGHDMWGSELNVAAKLGEDIAEQDEILLSEAAYRSLPCSKKYRFESRPVNISGMPCMAYRLSTKFK